MISLLSRSFILMLMAGTCASVILLLAMPSTLRADSSSVWEHYKTRFIQEDGRVIDVYNKQMSHSEGQGFTMYMALSFGDKELFHKLWTWTRDNLMTPRGDGLAAWSWGKREDGSWGVLDPNDATDGDLFLAWTLLAASERFGEMEYQDQARKIAAAIRSTLVARHGGAVVLLPGREGFVSKEGVVFNPSYFIFPAFYDLARLDDAAFWRGLHESCLTLMERSLAGPAKLPPDWAMLDASGVKPWDKRDGYFSYDAIRVPLYLSWDVNRKALAPFKGLIARFMEKGSLPARIAVVPGIEDKDEAPAGFYAVLGRTADTLGDGPAAKALWAKADAMISQEKDDYYSNALYLLSSTRGLK